MNDGKQNSYNQTPQALYKKLNTSSKGLSKSEAQKRLKLYGENKLQEAKKKSNFILFLEQFKDLLVYLLIIAAIFSFIVSYIRHESYADAIIIIIIVIINAILSFFQEKKADTAIQELNKMFITNTTVIRDGIKMRVDVRKIVVGDIIELEAGDYVCADARIITASNLLVNEATLTGESVAVLKNSEIIKEEKDIFERSNMLYAGCNVTNGHAQALVIATAMDTQLGKIAHSLTNKKSGLTPLQKKVNGISQKLTYAILAIILLMIIIGLIMQNDFFDVLTLSISLAVAAIPEGMSSVITIILSLGMTQMAKKNVIIRKMASVETLGSTNVICSDKTGTITQNKMVVTNIYFNNTLYTEKDEIPNFEIFKFCANMCHNVSHNKKNYLGDETEVAIYKYLEKGNLVVKNYERLAEYPFDSERKMMSTLNSIDDKKYLFTKGSLDSIINNCTKYVSDKGSKKITKAFKENLKKMEQDLSSKSLRLLAFAYKDKDFDNLEKDMTFIGLIGLMDPPRENVLDAITTCKNAGIRVIMITGDGLNTATAIAKDVGIIKSKSEAIEGKKIDKMTDEELKIALAKYSVYARISPQSKLRIVEGLQKEGLIVAMTGDGVNDAPAIQKADIGIGMGQTGTEVVKNVADCILVDDSFVTIVDGVNEGRRITSNIKKVMLYLLAGNIVEVILVFISLLLNMEMFSTLQLLWINLITDSIPAIMLAFEESESDLMTNNPTFRTANTFFTPFLNAKIIISAVFKSLVMLSLFIYFVKTMDASTASSLMFIFLIAHELLFAFSCRNLKKSILNKHILANKNLTLGVALIALVQIIVLTTSLSQFFIVPNLNLKYVFLTLGICFLVFVIEEIAKPLYVKFFKDYTEVPS